MSSNTLTTAPATTPSGPPLPLTTVFTAPANCGQNSDPSLTGLIGESRILFSNVWFDTDVDTATCYPPGFLDFTTYSPGILCPEGQTGVPLNTVEGRTVDLAATPEYEFTMRCCSSTGVDLISGTACGSILTTNAMSFRTLRDVVAGTYITLSVPTTYTYSNPQTFAIRHHGPRLVYRASDVPDSLSSQLLLARQQVINVPARVPATGSQSSPSNAAVDASGSLFATASSSLDTVPVSDVQNADSGGLSTGARAGIGAGVALGVILFVVLAAFLIIRRRRRNVGQSKDDTSNLHEVQGDFGQQTRNEKDGRSLYEAEGKVPAPLAREGHGSTHELAPSGSLHDDTTDQGFQSGVVAEEQTQRPINTSSESSTTATPFGHEISNIDREALRRREVEYLEQEEARIKRQKETLLTQRNQERVNGDESA